MGETGDDGSIQVGLLLKGGMRRLLAELKWRGDVADYFERKSLWESEFLVRGMTHRGEVIVRKWLREYADNAT